MKENFEKENKKEPSGFSSGAGFGKLGFGQEKETFGGESDGFGEGFGREKKDEEGFGKAFADNPQEDKKEFEKSFAGDSFGSSLQEEKKNFDSFSELSPDSDSFPEEKESEDGKAWYENTGDSWYRSNKASDEFLKEQKSEHRVHAMLEEHAKHSHVYTEKEREKAVSELDGASEKIEEREKKESSFQDGKIYLPKEKPLFESDSIENPREYIARNFGRNASVERMKGKSKPAFIILGVCFAFIALFSRMLSVYIAVVFTVLAAIFVFSGKPKNPSFLKKPEEFFLIKPYAIEKTAKSLSVSYALDLYYRIKGEARKAVTAAVYTEEQIDILTEAFLKGELVVACRIADRKGEPDTAVVCSPDPY